ncbi:hypothetical protein BDQ17DRAFT_1441500 [Cyathus striatus]|nr:hypothetical protein BDQ17DRAFT_1441500 [Cyathus striatus]
MSEPAGPSISLVNSSNTQSSELQQLEERLALVKAGKRSKATKRNDRDTDKENEVLHVVSGRRKGVKCKDGIQWSDSSYFHLTDLLTKIEENIPYRREFGFKTAGLDETRKNLTAILACRELAPIMFEKARTSPEHVERIANSIKAHIAFIKKKYFEYRKELGQTGHGLVEEGLEASIQVGTPIHNVWHKCFSSY